MTAPLPEAAGGPVPGYPMRRWYFEEARGRHTIDLGDSYLPCGRLSDLPQPPDLLLDYGSNQGDEQLRRAVAALYGRNPDEAVITHGGQEALYLLYRALLRPGDRVVAFAPGWQQSWDVPAALGNAVDLAPVRPDGSPDLAAAAQLVGPATRLLVLTSPGNPTGRRVRPEALAPLLPVLRHHRTVLVLDEEYVADLAADSLLGNYEHAVAVSSLSKVYGFPGLRTGWLVGPAGIVRDATAHRQSTTLSNSVLTSWYAHQVLRRRDHYLDRYHGLVRSGGAQLREWAAHHGDVLELVEPEGTPFCWLRLRDAGGPDSLDFCRGLLDRSGVLLMPAEVFGAERAVRLTFAREPDVLRAGLAAVSRELRRRDRR